MDENENAEGNRRVGRVMNNRKIYVCKISDFYISDGVSLPCQAKMLRYMQEKDKLRCLCGGLLLRFLLGEGANSIITNPYGKPYLPNSNTYFNLSHSGSYVVLAADTDEIGVDIELIQSVPSGISERCFTADEQAWLQSISNNPLYNHPHIQDCNWNADFAYSRNHANENENDWKYSGDSEAFYTLWTAKESIMKAIGKGFSIAPESFSVMPIESDFHNIDNTNWYLHWYELDGHVICTASRTNADTEFYYLRRKELVVSI